MALILSLKSVLRLPSHSYKNIRFSSSKCSFNKKGLVLGCYYEDSVGVTLTPAAEEFNKKTGGKLIDNIKLTGNKVKEGKGYLFWGLDNDFRSVAVVGLGKKNKGKDDLENICLDREAVRVAAAAGCKMLDSVEIKDIHVENFDGYAEAAAEGSKLGTWKFQEFKTKKDTLPEVNLYESPNDRDKWNLGIIKAEAQNIARRLADTPGNLMTPTIFAQNAVDLLKNVDVKVYDRKWAENEKMGAFLSVAKGSAEEPKFLEITYKNGCEGKPVVLVGKGVTFDAGGISLKPSGSMDQMRADMSGAASLVSTIYALSKLQAPANVIVLIPLTENLPSGTAVKPGDVVVAKNGKTIGVDNTDAEGRLILADALVYSGKFKPQWVLDIATLTGAMMIALGSAATGVFTNSNCLFDKIHKSGCLTGDRMWRMPLWKHYTNQINKNQGFDLNNISKTRGGGSCTAAAFLKEFIPENIDWMHLDIAGVMGPEPNDSTPYLGKGMSGRPTRTLIELLLNNN